MMNRISSSVVAAVLLSLSLVANAQSLRYSRVSREVVQARLARYAGDNKQRESTLKQVFSEAGCDDRHLSEQHVNDLSQPNVICLLPGSSDRVIIVGAHFDRVPAGDGVVDNWSGASLLPSLYQSTKTEPRKHTYIFIGFAGEESGEIGSRFYAQQMSKEDVAATDAMVNMDTLGLGSTQVWGSHSENLLVGALGYIAKQLNVPVSIVDVDQVGSSDSEQFAARKIPRITIHSLTQKTWEARIIHTSKDRISAIQADDYYQTYGLLAAYLTFLDEIPNRSTMPPNLQSTGEKSSDCEGQKSSSGDCITPPHPTYSPDPVYPVKERNTGHQGSVGLMLVVDTEGVPHDITVSRSLSPAFDAAALEAVKEWRFAPSTQNGKPITAKVAIQVEFHATSSR